MNGRCSNDPIDLAVDLCMYCGDEFCASCMVYPGGEKRPGACRACAVKAAGLRGKGEAQRVSKRAIKRRRDELAQMAAEHADANGFRFFDDPTSGFELHGPLDDLGSEPEPEKKRRRPSLRRRKDDEPTDSPATIQPPSGVPEADPTALPEGVGFDDFLGSDDGEHRDLQAEEMLAAAAAPVETERPPSATELLGRLKEAQGSQEPTPDEVPPPPPPAPAPSPVAETQAPPSHTPAFDPTPLSAPTRAAHAPAPAHTPPPAHDGISSPARRSESQAIAHDDQFTQPSMTATPAPETNPFDAFDPTRFDGAAFDEPAFADVPEPVAGPEQDPWVPATVTVAAAAVDDEPMPDLTVNPFASAASADDTADTDSSGNWIPPALRGMAPEAERTSLPRRR